MRTRNAQRLPQQCVVRHAPAGIQPGTRMPSFFYDENTPLTENPAQDILDLRNYLWTLRASPAPERASAAGATRSRARSSP
jgi:hypothetical protein